MTTNDDDYTEEDLWDEATAGVAPPAPPPRVVDNSPIVLPSGGNIKGAAAPPPPPPAAAPKPQPPAPPAAATKPVAAPAKPAAKPVTGKKVLVNSGKYANAPAPREARALGDVFRQIRTNALQKPPTAHDAPDTPTNARQKGLHTMKMFGHSLMRRETSLEHTSARAQLREHFAALQHSTNTQFEYVPPPAEEVIDVNMLPSTARHFVEYLLKVWPTIPAQQQHDIAHNDAELAAFITEFLAFMCQHLATLRDDLLHIASDTLLQRALVMLYEQYLSDSALSAVKLVNALLHAL